MYLIFTIKRKNPEIEFLHRESSLMMSNGVQRKPKFNEGTSFVASIHIQMWKQPICNHRSFLPRSTESDKLVQISILLQYFEVYEIWKWKVKHIEQFGVLFDKISTPKCWIFHPCSSSSWQPSLVSSPEFEINLIIYFLHKN